jgi:hypothetical protein
MNQRADALEYAQFIAVTGTAMRAHVAARDVIAESDRATLLTRDQTVT